MFAGLWFDFVMSEEIIERKRDLKFDEAILEFGFDGDKEYSNEEFKVFSRHARKVLSARQQLDEE